MAIANTTKSRDENNLPKTFEQYLNDDLLPAVLITPQQIEIVENNPVANRKALWEAMAPSLEILIDRFVLPRQKPAGQDDLDYFKFLVDTLYSQNMTIRNQNSEFVKWSSWPSVSEETVSANCSLNAQILLKLLENSGYQAEYATPGPLDHSVAIVKYNDKYYYLDATNGYMAEVAETIEVNGFKTHIMLSGDYRCPFHAVPSFPSECSTVGLITNLHALKKEYDNPSHSTVVEKLYNKFQLSTDGVDYVGWAENNLFPEWETLKNGEYWVAERTRVGMILGEELSPD